MSKFQLPIKNSLGLRAFQRFWRPYFPLFTLYCSLLSNRQFKQLKKQGTDQLDSSINLLILAIPEAVLSLKVRSITYVGLYLQREQHLWDGLIHKENCMFPQFYLN